MAKTVIDCLNDPRYKGKSFGVICLQGHAQAQLIENMILEQDRSPAVQGREDPVVVRRPLQLSGRRA